MIGVPSGRDRRHCLPHRPFPQQCPPNKPLTWGLEGHLRPGHCTWTFSIPTHFPTSCQNIARIPSTYKDFSWKWQFLKPLLDERKREREREPQLVSTQTKTLLVPLMLNYLWLCILDTSIQLSPLNFFFSQWGQNVGLEKEKAHWALGWGGFHLKQKGQWLLSALLSFSCHYSRKIINGHSCVIGECQVWHGCKCDCMAQC